MKHLCLIFQDPRVLDAMMPYLVTQYGNPHSRTHAYGWESEAAVEHARKVLNCGCMLANTIKLHWFLTLTLIISLPEGRYGRNTFFTPLLSLAAIYVAIVLV